MSVMDKLYEQIIKRRLENEVALKEGLSYIQYGFRKGRSASIVDVMRSVKETKSNALL